MNCVKQGLVAYTNLDIPAQFWGVAVAQGSRVVL